MSATGQEQMSKGPKMNSAFRPIADIFSNNADSNLEIQQV